jgi:hypothetical protein
MTKISMGESAVTIRCKCGSAVWADEADGLTRCTRCGSEQESVHFTEEKISDRDPEIGEMRERLRVLRIISKCGASDKIKQELTAAVMEVE